MDGVMTQVGSRITLTSGVSAVPGTILVASRMTFNGVSE